MNFIPILCQHCNEELKVEFQEELKGKKVNIRCKHCSKPITFRFPKVVGRNDSTLITAGISKTAMSAFLEINGNTELDKTKFEIQEGEQIVGRKSDKKFPDIAISTDDNSVSRLHCIINGKVNAKGQKEYTLKDNKSKNGVLLNDLQLCEYDEVYLQDKDEIYLGKMKFTFKLQYV